MISNMPGAGEIPNLETWLMEKYFLSRLKDSRMPTTTNILHSSTTSRKATSRTFPGTSTTSSSHILVSSKCS